MIVIMISFLFYCVSASCMEESREVKHWVPALAPTKEISYGTLLANTISGINIGLTLASCSRVAEDGLMHAGHYITPHYFACELANGIASTLCSRSSSLLPAVLATSNTCVAVINLGDAIFHSFFDVGDGCAEKDLIFAAASGATALYYLGLTLYNNSAWYRSLRRDKKDR